MPRLTNPKRKKNWPLLKIYCMKKAIQPFMIQFRMLALLLLATGLLPARLYAQEDTAAAKEEPSLLSPSLEFVAVQKGDSSIDLHATLRTKFKGSSLLLAHMKVTFLQVSDSAEEEIGKVITDKRGKAVFNIKPGGIRMAADGSVHFKASFAGNKAMEAAEEEVSFKRARIIVTPVKADSLYTVNIRIVAMGRGEPVPVDSVTAGVYVHRLFNPLKLGEGTTDENGETQVEIPAKLPGDAKGNLGIIARLDENETYGYLETTVPAPWGVAVSDANKELPRALWSAHPPIWMLVTFIILMVTVWGHYIVITYEMIRLRKEEPHNNTATN